MPTRTGFYICQRYRCISALFCCLDLLLVVQDNREPFAGLKPEIKTRGCLQPCPTNHRSKEAAHSSSTKPSILQMWWAKMIFLKAQSCDPTACGQGGTYFISASGGFFSSSFPARTEQQ